MTSNPVLKACGEISPKDKCNVCTKSGLAVLLARPSVIALDDKNHLAPPNEKSLQSPTDALKNLVPAKATDLKKSRYVLRTLRAGYLYVYFEKNDTLHTYRITDDGDLIRKDHPLFSTQAEIQCTRNMHNAQALKVIHIPDAHLQTNVWLAFSANSWDNKLRIQNKANPKVMQKIDVAALLGGKLPNNSFEATEVALTTKIAEYCLDSWERPNDPSIQGKSFPFKSLKDRAGAVIKQMQAMADAHPTTKDKQPIVMVLRDPVAVATELNELRIARHEKGQKWLHTEPNLHPLQVNQTIQSLRKSLGDGKLNEALDQVRPIRTEGRFKDEKPHYATYGWINPRWVALTDYYDVNNPQEAAMLTDIRLRWAGSGEFGPLGVVVTDNEEARARDWIERNVQSEWGRFEKFYDEAARKRWNDDLYKEMLQLHGKPLKDFENDWNAWIDSDELLVHYFDLHFDADSVNDVKADLARGCSSGSVYCNEAHSALVPANFTEIPQDFFYAQLDADIKDKRAVMQRALFGNQNSVIEKFESTIAQLVNDPGNEQGGKRDKFYDFMKGLITLERMTAGGVEAPVIPRVSWMSPGMVFFASGIVQSLGATAIAVTSQAAISAGAAGAASPSSAAAAGQAARQTARDLVARAKAQWNKLLEPIQLERLRKAQALALATQSIEAGMRSILDPNAAKLAKLPIIITARVPSNIGIGMMNAIGYTPSAKRLRHLRKPTELDVTIVTDSEQIKHLGPDVMAAAKNHAARLRVTVMPSGIAADAVKDKTHLVVTADAYNDFYNKEMQRQQAAASRLVSRRQWGKATQTAIADFDGRLAIGGMLVQGIGLWIAVAKWQKEQKAGNAEEVANAILATVDGAAGLLGGTFDLWAVALKSRLVAQNGAQAGSVAVQSRLTVQAGSVAARKAVEASAGMASLRAFSAIFGVASGLVNAYANFRLAVQLERRGEEDLAQLSYRSMALFGTSALAFGAVAIHMGATSMANRVAANVAVNVAARALATQTAWAVGWRVAGFAVVPVAGWFVTAVAVGITVYVAVNTPSELEKWLKDGVFGKNGEKRFKTWVEAEQELMKIMDAQKAPMP